MIETKAAGSTTVTRAEYSIPGSRARGRRARLDELAAGFAEEVHEGSPADHFTRIVRSVNADVWAIGQDPTAFYRLVEACGDPAAPVDRRPPGRRLATVSPELVAVIAGAHRRLVAPVSRPQRVGAGIELRRRAFGDDQAASRTGRAAAPAFKTIRVPGDARRKIVVAGFLLNQKRAQADWSGLTARVQNVAVEEHTFFDVTADPGFRKYISGEIWLLGDVDRERLINIDRSSFNRECSDYQGRTARNGAGRSSSSSRGACSAPSGRRSPSGGIWKTTSGH